jgi:hypothetical protein
MADKLALTALANRVGALKGADRAIDREIFVLMGARDIDGRSFDYQDWTYADADECDYGLGEWQRNIPRFTRSIDDAVAFKDAMLPGWAWSVDWRASAWVQDTRVQGYPSFDSGFFASPHPAIALVLAVLKALEAQHGEG